MCGAALESDGSAMSRQTLTTGARLAAAPAWKQIKAESIAGYSWARHWRVLLLLRAHQGSLWKAFRVQLKPAEETCSIASSAKQARRCP